MRTIMSILPKITQVIWIARYKNNPIVELLPNDAP